MRPLFSFEGCSMPERMAVRINTWQGKSPAGRGRKMFKKAVCMLAALVIGVCAMGTASAREAREQIQFTCVGAEQLWKEAAAGETAEAARQEGLEHPVEEESLVASGARISREDGLIYMIRSDAELGKVRTPGEALRMAWSLARLLGGDEGMELELYARLGIGKTDVYCFSQTRNGEPMYGRMLKIVADGDGGVYTVINSLGFPEETDESLGAGEDLLGQKLMEAETPDVPDFTRMVRAEWSCEAETGLGDTVHMTVPVVQDPETGQWYLADPERKIVMGDFRKMVMEERKDCLLSSAENAGWDVNDVMVYYRLLQCWDDYARMGWIGPDGQGTPVLALNNLCMLNGESMGNACYVGMLQGRWQGFAYSREEGFGRCLDVISHEYTHCITETSAAGGMYKDDYGAINEAISDILGNLCEMRLGETTDRDWNIGENLGSTFRSMSNPHEYNQPEYVWDQFYASKALHPNDSNDRGGVHTNSSILNYTASQLCLEGGMTLEEATDFWMAVDLGLSSRTDYFQMAELLEWALETVGLEKYAGATRALTEKTRMTLIGRPETVGKGLMRVELSLPDTEVMRDHGWTVIGLQVDTWEAIGTILDLLIHSAEGEADLFSLLEELTAEETSASEWSSPALTDMTNRLSKAFRSYYGWQAAEGEPITMMMEQGLATFYFLVNIDLNRMELRTVVPLFGNEWVDLMTLASDDMEMDEEQAMKILDTLLGMGSELLFPEVTESRVLPVAGLESITLPPAEEEG